MLRPETHPILSDLRNPASSAAQVAALKALKNEIVGHSQKKEEWIKLGVLEPLTNILNTFKGDGKRTHRAANGSAHRSRQRERRTNEEEARYQAIVVVGSLAQGKSISS